MTLPRRLRTVILGTIAVALWAVALANCWSALRDPVELEVREGTVWLYVLAQSAGQSLYDYHQVAFLNMNHGPMDPLLKAWIHALAPFLPSQVVTRFFAALLPLGLWLGFWTGIRSSLRAVLWAGGLYVFLLGLGPAQFLIGRSDPTALFALVGLIALLEIFGRCPSLSPGRALGLGAAAGVIAMAAVLVNWRYLPPVLVALAVFGVEWRIGRETAPSSRSVRVGGFVGMFLGAGTVFLAIAGTLFHGCFDLYYRHFFGVFSRASGWGAQGRMPYELFPRELRDGFWLVHLALVIALLTAAAQARGDRRRQTGFIAWLTGLAALWLAITWGFFYNHGGGGLHYFAPWYLLCGYFAATRVDWSAAGGLRGAVMTSLLVIGLPWVPVARQAFRLARTADQARRFDSQLQAFVAHRRAYSEDLHLFKHCYQGERIDMGDMVARVAAANYFPPAFRDLVERHYTELAANPPDLVIVGAHSVLSPNLQRLLARRYRLLLQSPPLLLGNGDDSRVTVYAAKTGPAPR